MYISRLPTLLNQVQAKVAGPFLRLLIINIPKKSEAERGIYNRGRGTKNWRLQLTSTSLPHLAVFARP